MLKKWSTHPLAVIDAAVDELLILKDQYELIQYYHTITEGTTGTVPIPTGYTIEENRFAEGIDGVITKIGADARPTNQGAYTAAGVIISTTLATNGNYVLSGIPSAYSVCLVYYLKGQRKYRGNLTFANELDSVEYFMQTKFGDGGVTNYSEFEPNGFIKHYGSSKYWVDIDFPVLIRTTGVGVPALATFNGNLTMPQWEVNDFNVCESQEFIHAWDEGSRCYWHIHLTTNGTNVDNRYVRFDLEYAYTDGNGLWVFPNVVTTSDLLIPANTPSKTQLIMSITDFLPTGTKIGGHAVARLKRVASVGNAPSAEPWVPMLQLHVLCDTEGSRNMTSK
jgi:hypothetical protein